ncbi:MAG: cls [Thermoleophilia bacterium]|nr:cls [Thermoleophilia bacterium]
MRQVSSVHAPLNNAAVHAQLDDIIRLGDGAAGALLPTAGNRFELIEGTSEFASRLIADIGNAKQQINLSEFAMHPGTTGEISRPVQDALMARAREGLPVNVQLDWAASAKPGYRDMVAEMEAAGVQVKMKPLTVGRGGLDDARLALDHRKIFEIDGKITWQGGINLVDEWAGFHDVMLRGEGPIAAQAGGLLAARWRDLGGTVSDARAAILHAGLDAPVTNALESTRQLSNGNRNRRELTEHFIAAAQNAKERLWLTNPYLGDPEVMKHVVDAAKRGVDVRLLLAPKATSAQPWDWVTDPLRRAHASEIRDAGGTVVQLPIFSHAKAWIADNEAGIGSFNLDKFSTRQNYENAIATTDPSAVRQLEALFDLQASRGSLATDQSSEGWRTLAKVRNFLDLQY